jgi:hypothetical protein
MKLTQIPTNVTAVGAGGPVVKVLDIRPKVRGFKPGRGQCIFKGDKGRSTTSCGGWGRRQAIGPMS